MAKREGPGVQLPSPQMPMGCVPLARAVSCSKPAFSHLKKGKTDEHPACSMVVGSDYEVGRSTEPGMSQALGTCKLVSCQGRGSLWEHGAGRRASR